MCGCREPRTVCTLRGTRLENAALVGRRRCINTSQLAPTPMREENTKLAKREQLNLSLNEMYNWTLFALWQPYSTV